MKAEKALLKNEKYSSQIDDISASSQSPVEAPSPVPPKEDGNDDKINSLLKEL